MPVTLPSSATVIMIFPKLISRCTSPHCFLADPIAMTIMSGVFLIVATIKHTFEAVTEFYYEQFGVWSALYGIC